jgi:toxin ParE1/3/4
VVELRLTAAARADIVDLLDVSFDNLGPISRQRYEALIDAALEDLRLDPEPIGSAARPELGHGLRTYHLRHSQKRARTADGIVRTPRHLLAYDQPHPGLVLVVRVLQDSMDLERNLPRDDQSGEPG